MLVLLFLVALVLVGLVVAQSIRQGRRFIRAATYLNELEGGRPVHEANAIAAILFSGESSATADAHAAALARARATARGESQTQIIGAAQSLGFEG